MQYRFIFSAVLTTVWATCFMSCDDTTSSTESAVIDAIDSIPGVKVVVHSSASEELSSSNEMSSHEGSSSSGKSSLSIEENVSSFEESSSSSEEKNSLPEGSGSSMAEESSSSSEEKNSLPEGSGSSMAEESSSSEEESSSSVVNQQPDIGTCGPKKSGVEKGEEVNWLFTNNSTVFPNSWLLRSTFIWTTSDGNPPLATYIGYKGVKHNASYTTSGEHQATLHINVSDGFSYDFTCSSVHVNEDQNP